MTVKGYLLSLPERVVRSVLGLGAGMAREVGEVVVPDGVRQGRLYQSLVDTTLRFLIDAVGIDQVVLGTDYPAPMILEDCVRWINGLEGLTASEKDAILSKNPARLLGI